MHRPSCCACISFRRSFPHSSGAGGLSIEENVDSNDGWYEKPKNVVGLLVEPISGKPLSDSSKNTKLVYFLKGTEPHIADPTFDEIFDSEES